MRFLIFCLLLVLPSAMAFDYPPRLDGAKRETYRTVGDTKLDLWIFGETDPAAPKPAIVFFFGGS